MTFSVTAVIPHFEALFWHCEEHILLLIHQHSEARLRGIHHSQKRKCRVTVHSFQLLLWWKCSLFTTARTPKKKKGSLQLTIAQTARKIAAEPPASVIIQIYVLFHQETLMHIPYCILFIPPASRPPCRRSPSSSNVFFPFPALIKNWRVLFCFCLLVYLMSFALVCRGGGGLLGGYKDSGKETDKMRDVGLGGCRIVWFH